MELKKKKEKHGTALRRGETRSGRKQVALSELYEATHDYLIYELALPNQLFEAIIHLALMTLGALCVCLCIASWLFVCVRYAEILVFLFLAQDPVLC